MTKPESDNETTLAIVAIVKVCDIIAIVASLVSAAWILAAIVIWLWSHEGWLIGTATIAVIVIGLCAAYYFLFRSRLEIKTGG